MRRTAKIILLAIFCIIAVFFVGNITLEVFFGDKLIVADEGIRPVQMGENDKELLKKFGLDSTNAALFNFTAPKEAESMMVDTFILHGGQWEKLASCGGLSLGGDREEYGRLHGELSVKLSHEKNLITNQIEEKNVELRFMVGNTLGKTSADLDTGNSFEYLAYSVAFLDEEREIVLGERIPIALFLYNDESKIPVYSVQHYDTPDKRFDIVKEVIAVTVTFTE